jgi:hypothetical protein
MLWDCSACGSAGLLGLSHRYCPACGSAQDPDRRYFPAEAQKVAVADHPYQGADRACSACEAPNAARAEFCVGCGGPLAGARAVAARAEQVAAQGGFADDSAADARKEASARRVADRAARASAQVPPKPTSSKLLWVLAAIGVMVAVCGLVAFFVFSTRTSTVQVVEHAWQRTVAVEALETVSESAWRGEVPVDARAPVCREEERSSRKVEDGETCTPLRTDNGDGTFRESERCTPNYRSEPVYDTRCTFTVDRWQAKREEKADGVGTTPEWPPVSIRSGASVGAEREAARREAYTLTFRDAEGRRLSCALDQERWASITDGSTWVAPTGRFVESIDCSALRAP